MSSRRSSMQRDAEGASSSSQSQPFAVPTLPPTRRSSIQNGSNGSNGSNNAPATQSPDIEIVDAPSSRLRRRSSRTPAELGLIVPKEEVDDDEEYMPPVYARAPGKRVVKVSERLRAALENPEIEAAVAKDIKQELVEDDEEQQEVMPKPKRRRANADLLLLAENLNNPMEVEENLDETSDNQYQPPAKRSRRRATLDPAVLVELSDTDKDEEADVLYIPPQRSRRRATIDRMDLRAAEDSDKDVEEIEPQPAKQKRTRRNANQILLAENMKKADEIKKEIEEDAGQQLSADQVEIQPKSANQLADQPQTVDQMDQIETHPRPADLKEVQSPFQLSNNSHVADQVDLQPQPENLNEIETQATPPTKQQTTQQQLTEHMEVQPLPADEAVETEEAVNANNQEEDFDDIADRLQQISLKNKTKPRRRAVNGIEKESSDDEALQIPSKTVKRRQRRKRTDTPQDGSERETSDEEEQAPPKPKRKRTNASQIDADNVVEVPIKRRKTKAVEDVEVEKEKEPEPSIDEPSTSKGTEQKNQSGGKKKTVRFLEEVTVVPYEKEAGPIQSSLVSESDLKFMNEYAKAKGIPKNILQKLNARKPSLTIVMRDRRIKRGTRLSPTVAFKISAKTMASIKQLNEQEEEEPYELQETKKKKKKSKRKGKKKKEPAPKAVYSKSKDLTTRKDHLEGVEDEAEYELLVRLGWFIEKKDRWGNPTVLDKRRGAWRKRVATNLGPPVELEEDKPGIREFNYTNHVRQMLPRIFRPHHVVNWEDDDHVFIEPDYDPALVTTNLYGMEKIIAENAKSLDNMREERQASLNTSEKEVIKEACTSSSQSNSVKTTGVETTKPTKLPDTHPDFQSTSTYRSPHESNGSSSKLNVRNSSSAQNGKQSSDILEERPVFQDTEEYTSKRHQSNNGDVTIDQNKKSTEEKVLEPDPDFQCSSGCAVSDTSTANNSKSNSANEIMQEADPWISEFRQQLDVVEKTETIPEPTTTSRCRSFVIPIAKKTRFNNTRIRAMVERRKEMMQMRRKENAETKRKTDFDDKCKGVDKIKEKSGVENPTEPQVQVKKVEVPDNYIKPEDVDATAPRSLLLYRVWCRNCRNPYYLEGTNTEAADVNCRHPYCLNCFRESGCCGCRTEVFPDHSGIPFTDLKMPENYRFVRMKYLPYPKKVPIQTEKKRGRRKKKAPVDENPGSSGEEEAELMKNLPDIPKDLDFSFMKKLDLEYDEVESENETDDDYEGEEIRFRLNPHLPESTKRFFNHLIDVYKKAIADKKSGRWKEEVIKQKRTIRMINTLNSNIQRRKFEMRKEMKKMSMRRTVLKKLYLKKHCNTPVGRRPRALAIHHNWLRRRLLKEQKDRAFLRSLMLKKRKGKKKRRPDDDDGEANEDAIVYNIAPIVPIPWVTNKERDEAAQARLAAKKQTADNKKKTKKGTEVVQKEHIEPTKKSERIARKRGQPIENEEEEQHEESQKQLEAIVAQMRLEVETLKKAKEKPRRVMRAVHLRFKEPPKLKPAVMNVLSKFMKDNEFSNLQQFKHILDMNKSGAKIPLDRFLDYQKPRFVLNLPENFNFIKYPWAHNPALKSKNQVLAAKILEANRRRLQLGKRLPVLKPQPKPIQREVVQANRPPQVPRRPLKMMRVMPPQTEPQQQMPVLQSQPEPSLQSKPMPVQQSRLLQMLTSQPMSDQHSQPMCVLPSETMPAQESRLMQMLKSRPMPEPQSQPILAPQSEPMPVLEPETMPVLQPQSPEPQSTTQESDAMPVLHPQPPPVLQKPRLVKLTGPPILFRVPILPSPKGTSSPTAARVLPSAPNNPDMPPKLEKMVQQFQAPKGFVRTGFVQISNPRTLAPVRTDPSSSQTSQANFVKSLCELKPIMPSGSNPPRMMAIPLSAVAKDQFSQPQLPPRFVQLPLRAEPIPVPDGPPVLTREVLQRPYDAAPLRETTPSSSQRKLVSILPKPKSVPQNTPAPHIPGMAYPAVPFPIVKRLPEVVEPSPPPPPPPPPPAKTPAVNMEKLIKKILEKKLLTLNGTPQLPKCREKKDDVNSVNNGASTSSKPSTSTAGPKSATSSKPAAPSTLTAVPKLDNIEEVRKMIKLLNDSTSTAASHSEIVKTFRSIMAKKPDASLSTSVSRLENRKIVKQIIVNKPEASTSATSSNVASTSTEAPNSEYRKIIKKSIASRPTAASTSTDVPTSDAPSGSNTVLSTYAASTSSVIANDSSIAASSATTSPEIKKMRLVKKIIRKVKKPDESIPTAAISTNGASTSTAAPNLVTRKIVKRVVVKPTDDSSSATTSASTVAPELEKMKLVRRVIRKIKKPDDLTSTASTSNGASTSTGAPTLVTRKHVERVFIKKGDNSSASDLASTSTGAPSLENKKVIRRIIKKNDGSTMSEIASAPTVVLKSGASSTATQPAAFMSDIPSTSTAPPTFKKMELGKLMRTIPQFKKVPKTKPAGGMPNGSDRQMTVTLIPGVLPPDFPKTHMKIQLSGTDQLGHILEYVTTRCKNANIDMVGYKVFCSVALFYRKPDEVEMIKNDKLMVAEDEKLTVTGYYGFDKNQKFLKPEWRVFQMQQKNDSFPQDTLYLVYNIHKPKPKVATA